MLVRRACNALMHARHSSEPDPVAVSIRVILFLLGASLTPACSSLPPVEHPQISQAFHAPGPTLLAAQVLDRAKRHTGRSGFLILDTGQQAFLQRASLIEAAERSIDAQYYIWNSDTSGRYLARRLLLAADRGVRVRLLLDDINVSGRDRLIAALDQHENIEIRIYNPLAVRDGPGKLLSFAVDFQRMNRRMHNKTFVVDGAMGIVGGRNIGDEYFDLHPRMNHRDRDVLAAGPIVKDMSRNFDAYWNSAWSYPIAQLARDVPGESEYAEWVAQARASAAGVAGLSAQPVQHQATALEVLKQVLQELVWAPAELVFDPPQDMNAPADRPKKTADALRELVARTQSGLLIESAYLILAEPQLEMMDELGDRGVEVAAITNSLATNDLIANHAGYARWRPAMLDHGIQLYELRPDATACRVWVEPPEYCNSRAVSLHAKSAVFDRKTLYVGSFNINLRSIFLNGETVLIIHSPALAEQVASAIETAMSPRNSWRVSATDGGHLRWSSSVDSGLTHEPETGWWRRFKSSVLSRLPIEKYL